MTAIEHRLAAVWARASSSHGRVPTPSREARVGDECFARALVDEVHRTFNVRLSVHRLLAVESTMSEVAATIEAELNCGPLSN